MARGRPCATTGPRMVLSPLRPALCASLRPGGWSRRLLHRVGDARATRSATRPTAIRRCARSAPWRRRFEAILGPDTRIGYAADWSEYFGHQPGDGSGDVFYHLDPLWASPAIDFIGIDNYMPLSDWRDGAGHADRAAGSIYDLAYLKGNVAGGEGYDWYYADTAGRAAQDRIPIRDGAYGEDWVFRYKDLVSWWSRPHFNRPGGARRRRRRPGSRGRSRSGSPSSAARR